jgi:hypothetical protein
MMRIHELKRYGLKVTLSSQKSGRDLVEITLGSEIRTLSLNEFTGFWLDMVDISRQGTAAKLNFLMEPSARNRSQSLQRGSSYGKKGRSVFARKSGS